MAIESINDIASHIIAEENFGTIDQYHDIPHTFIREDLTDDKLAEKWIRMVSFWNILVYGYTEIGRNEVYKIIQKDLDDI